MIEKVRRTIAEHQLLTKGDRVVVAFSGGIDSVCLLHVLANLTEHQLDLWAVYINHSLRPAENEREISLLESLGEKWQVKTKVFTLDLPQKLKEKPQSLQLLAREERYRIFSEFAGQVQAARVALGHHRDDQAETILFRIIRGTGLEGLAGMSFKRDSLFIRPLLEVSRAEIYNYVNVNQLTWIEDSSNHKLIYRRNQIRHQLLPLIENNYNPRFREALLRLGNLAEEQSDFLSGQVAEWSKTLLIKENGKIGFLLNRFREGHSYLQYCFLKKTLESLRPNCHFEVNTLERLRRKLNEGANFKSCGVQQKVFVYRQGELAFFTLEPQVYGFRETSFRLKSPGRTRLGETGLVADIELVAETPNWDRVKNDEAFLTLNSECFPLRIRFWRPGDIFWPLGAPGPQKLQDFFVDHKVPREERSNIPLLVTANGRIAWVTGYRTDEGFKVGQDAGEIWRVQVQRVTGD